jgi:tetratricopeptide (TPR) repeat protein
MLKSGLGMMRIGFSQFRNLLFLIIPVCLYSQPSFQQGSEFFGQKKYDSALVMFNQMINDSANSKLGYYDRGLCFYELGNFDEAVNDFNASLRLDSLFYDARCMLALALLNQNQLKQAESELAKLDTKYSGYNNLKKRIKYKAITVLISKQWYYMIAIMFMAIILITIVAKMFSYKKGM